MPGALQLHESTALYAFLPTVSTPNNLPWFAAFIMPSGLQPSGRLSNACPDARFYTKKHPVFAHFLIRSYSGTGICYRILFCTRMVFNEALGWTTVDILS